MVSGLSPGIAPGSQRGLVLPRPRPGRCPGSARSTLCRYVGRTDYPGGGGGSGSVRDRARQPAKRSGPAAEQAREPPPSEVVPRTRGGGPAAALHYGGCGGGDRGPPDLARKGGAPPAVRLVGLLLNLHGCGGGDAIRTRALRCMRPALCQLSYPAAWAEVNGLHPNQANPHDALIAAFQSTPRH